MFSCTAIPQKCYIHRLTSLAHRLNQSQLICETELVIVTLVIRSAYSKRLTLFAFVPREIVIYFCLQLEHESLNHGSSEIVLVVFKAKISLQYKIVDQGRTSRDFGLKLRLEHVELSRYR